MRAYLTAEWGKAVARPYYRIYLTVMAAWWTGREGMFQGSFGECLSLLIPFFSAGIYLAVIVADAVFSDQYKTGTLKNEVSYGIPRERIYLGKLATAAAAGLLLVFLTLLAYAVLCRLLIPAGPEDWQAVQTFLFRLLAAVPLWLGALALTMAVMFNVGQTIPVMVVVLLLLAGLGPVFRGMMRLAGGWRRCSTVSPSPPPWIWAPCPCGIRPTCSGAGGWACCGRRAAPPSAWPCSPGGTFTEKREGETVLNYIKAELWKVSRRQVFYILLALLVLCTAVFTGTSSLKGFPSLAAAVSNTMITGFLAAPLLVQLVDGGGADTLKNELSFGLSRGRIYWGKLCASLLLGAGICALLVGGSLLAGWLLLPHGAEGEAAWALNVVGFCLLGALPVWCGLFAMCHTLALLVRSTAAWVAGYYLTFFVGQPILVFLAMLLFNVYEATETFSLVTAILMPYSLLMPAVLEDWLTSQYQLWCWGVGLGWLTAATGVGMLIFTRKNVR